MRKSQFESYAERLASAGYTFVIQIGVATNGGRHIAAIMATKSMDNAIVQPGLKAKFSMSEIVTWECSAVSQKRLESMEKVIIRRRWVYQTKH